MVSGAVKTVATMGLAQRAAESYGVRTVNVLTGLKFVGEVIGRLEAGGRERGFVCAQSSWDGIGRQHPHHHAGDESLHQGARGVSPSERRCS